VFEVSRNVLAGTSILNVYRKVEREHPRASPTAGPHMGLTVLVHTNLSDYFYPSIPVIGLKVCRLFTDISFIFDRNPLR